MGSPPALTPTFMPYRPSGDGWVAYHDLEPVTGVAGLAMTWRGTDGKLSWKAVFNRVRGGHVTSGGRLLESQDVTEVLALAWRNQSPTHFQTSRLDLLLPRSEASSKIEDRAGLPPVAEHAAIARQALAQATLPSSMRSALEACLDHGVPSLSGLQALRTRTHDALWPALAFGAANPALADMVLTCRPSLMVNDDPLKAVFRQWPGLTEAHLRRFRGHDAPVAGSGATRSKQAAQSSMDLLAACPSEWWPRREEWHMFVDCAETLGAIRSASSNELSLRGLAASSKGIWSDFRMRLCRAAGFPIGSKNGTNLVNTGRDCGDPVRSLARGIILPLIASREDEERVQLIEASLEAEFPEPDRSDGGSTIALAGMAAARLLYGEKSATTIIETSMEWHAGQEAMEAEVRREDGTATWPALFDGEHRDGDVGIVVISDYAGLRDEGAEGLDGDGVMGLHHCITSRLTKCLSGWSHVLSVRLHHPDGTWRRLSTCEISTTTNDGHVRVSVVEHRGRGNVEPEPAAAAGVLRLTKAIEAGHVAVSDEALSLNREGRGLEAHCGYDWRDPAALANAIGAWRSFLPRWARDLAPDDLLQAIVDRRMLPELESLTPAMR